MKLLFASTFFLSFGIFGCGPRTLNSLKEDANI